MNDSGSSPKKRHPRFGHMLARDTPAAALQSQASPKKCCGFAVGDAIKLGKGNTGIVRFVGSLQGQAGQWVGVELSSAVGNTDGVYKGQQLFKCAPKKGMFVSALKLKQLVGDRQLPVTSPRSKRASPQSSSPARRAAPPHDGGGTLRAKRGPTPAANAHVLSYSRGAEAFLDAETSGPVFDQAPFLPGQFPRAAVAVLEDRGLTGDVLSLFVDKPLLQTRFMIWVMSDRRTRCEVLSWLEADGEQKARSLADEAGTQNHKERSPHTGVRVGDRVIVAGKLAGVARFFGQTEFAPGTWAGVELDKPLGKNNGTVQGRAYFSCEDKHGIFVDPLKTPLVHVSKSPYSTRDSDNVDDSVKEYREFCDFLHTIPAATAGATASVERDRRLPESYTRDASLYVDERLCDLMDSHSEELRALGSQHAKQRLAAVQEAYTRADVKMILQEVEDALAMEEKAQKDAWTRVAAGEVEKAAASGSTAQKISLSVFSKLQTEWAAEKMKKREEAHANIAPALRSALAAAQSTQLAELMRVKNAHTEETQQCRANLARGIDDDAEHEASEKIIDVLTAAEVGNSRLTTGHASATSHLSMVSAANLQVEVAVAQTRALVDSTERQHSMVQRVVQRVSRERYVLEAAMSTSGDNEGKRKEAWNAARAKIDMMLSENARHIEALTVEVERMLAVVAAQKTAAFNRREASDQLKEDAIRHRHALEREALKAEVKELKVGEIARARDLISRTKMAAEEEVRQAEERVQWLRTSPSASEVDQQQAGLDLEHTLRDTNERISNVEATALREAEARVHLRSVVKEHAVEDRHDMERLTQQHRREEEELEDSLWYHCFEQERLANGKKAVLAATTRDEVKAYKALLVTQQQNVQSPEQRARIEADGKAYLQRLQDKAAADRKAIDTEEKASVSVVSKERREALKRRQAEQIMTLRVLAQRHESERRELEVDCSRIRADAVQSLHDRARGVEDVFKRRIAQAHEVLDAAMDGLATDAEQAQAIAQHGASIAMLEAGQSRVLGVLQAASRQAVADVVAAREQHVLARHADERAHVCADRESLQKLYATIISRQSLQHRNVTAAWRRRAEELAADCKESIRAANERLTAFLLGGNRADMSTVDTYKDEVNAAVNKFSRLQRIEEAKATSQHLSLETEADVQLHEECSRSKLQGICTVAIAANAAEERMAAEEARIVCDSTVKMLDNTLRMQLEELERQLHHSPDHCNRRTHDAEVTALQEKHARECKQAEEACQWQLRAAADKRQRGDEEARAALAEGAHGLSEQQKAHELEVEQAKASAEKECELRRSKLEEEVQGLQKKKDELCSAIEKEKAAALEGVGKEEQSKMAEMVATFKKNTAILSTTRKAKMKHELDDSLSRIEAKVNMDRNDIARTFQAQQRHIARHISEQTTAAQLQHNEYVDAAVESAAQSARKTAMIALTDDEIRRHQVELKTAMIRAQAAEDKAKEQHALLRGYENVHAKREMVKDKLKHQMETEVLGQAQTIEEKNAIIAKYELKMKKLEALVDERKTLIKSKQEANDATIRARKDLRADHEDIANEFLPPVKSATVPDGAASGREEMEHLVEDLKLMFGDLLKREHDVAKKERLQKFEQALTDEKCDTTVKDLIIRARRMSIARAESNDLSKRGHHGHHHHHAKAPDAIQEEEDDMSESEYGYEDYDDDDEDMVFSDEEGDTESKMLSRSPQYFVTQLNLDATSRLVRYCKLAMKANGEKWVKGFASKDGFGFIVELVSRVARHSASHRSESEQSLLLEAVKAIKVLAMSDYAMAIAEADTLFAVPVVQALEDAPTHLTRKTCQSLASMMMHSPESHDQVLEAFSAHQENHGHGHRFEPVLKALGTDDPQLQLAALQCINAIVEGSPHADTRAIVRQELLEQDIQQLLEMIEGFEDAPEEVCGEVERFNHLMDSDREELEFRKVDLSDPVAIMMTLKPQLRCTQSYPHLVKIVQLLMAVPTRGHLGKSAWRELAALHQSVIEPLRGGDNSAASRSNALLHAPQLENEAEWADDQAVVAAKGFLTKMDSNSGGGLLRLFAAVETKEFVDGLHTRAIESEAALAKLREQMDAFGNPLSADSGSKAGARALAELKKAETSHGEQMAASKDAARAAWRTLQLQAKHQRARYDVTVNAWKQHSDSLRNELDNARKKGNLWELHEQTEKKRLTLNFRKAVRKLIMKHTMAGVFGDITMHIPPGLASPSPSPEKQRAGAPPPTPPPPPNVGAPPPPPPPPPPGGGPPPPPPPPPGGPPPPPPPPGGGPPPPPPPPGGGPPPPPPPPGGGPPPPPPPPGGGPPRPPGPPPPPGGGPPPPPGAPAVAIRKPSVPMKKLHWSKLPMMKLRGSVFETMHKGGAAISYEELEKIFTSKRPGPVKKPKENKPAKPKKIQLLDVKKSNNIGIMLAKMKVNGDQVRDAILELDPKMLTDDNLASIINNLPEDSEVEQLRSFEQPLELLPKPELYVRAIMDIPRLNARLEALKTKNAFGPKFLDVKEQVTLVAAAITGVAESESLRKVLDLLLTIGNFMNGSKPVDGFKVAYLKKIKDTKSCDNKISLLNYVADCISKQSPDLAQFTEDLKHVEEGTKYPLAGIEGELASLKKSLTIVETEVKHAASVDVLLDVLGPFLTDAQKECEGLEHQLTATIQEYDKTVKHFGDTASSLKPEDFCDIFSTFRADYLTAVAQNKKAKEAEKKAARKAKAKEEADKRKKKRKKKKKK